MSSKKRTPLPSSQTVAYTSPSPKPTYPPVMEDIPDNVCPVCDRVYPSNFDSVRAQRDAHIEKSHPGQKPFRCLRYPQRFTTRQSLHYHVRDDQELHLDGAPAVKVETCSICDQAFTAESSMLDHFKRVHSKTIQTQSPGKVPEAYQCLGSGCTLCFAGNRKESRDFIKHVEDVHPEMCYEYYDDGKADQDHQNIGERLEAQLDFVSVDHRQRLQPPSNLIASLDDRRHSLILQPLDSLHVGDVNRQPLLDDGLNVHQRPEASGRPPYDSHETARALLRNAQARLREEPVAYQHSPAHVQQASPEAHDKNMISTVDKDDPRWQRPEFTPQHQYRLYQYRSARGPNAAQYTGNGVEGLNMQERLEYLRTFVPMDLESYVSRQQIRDSHLHAVNAQQYGYRDLYANQPQTSWTGARQALANAEVQQFPEIRVQDEEGDDPMGL
ncbi:hypothetical protein B0J14DRAFT_564101 [Halenospora varia]|nr:hypothetical protein B0J14DRAFT_564101 [Halenospora varia]